ncbi:MAG: UDP-2,3-diacylglucosamine diphosphatase [Candidatus Krumholzibacteriia bacterium]
MTCNQDIAGVEAVFLADSHFHVDRDPTEERRLHAFCELLDAHRGAPDVVLLGDIFDFWFDYPHFYMKGYEPVLRGLDALRDSGTRLHFVGGNHDIWAARFLHDRYGTAPAAGPVTLEIEGHRVRCVHGDGLLGRDLFYRAFRAIVRHPAGVLLGKSLHPEALFAFSAWLSKSSRHSTRDEAAGIERKAAAWLARQDAAPWDHLVMGHVHHCYTVAHQERRLSCLGGWFDELHYAVWRAGRLEHRLWPTA